jgi:asparagine synthase (glutamine-hydrolysing)
MSDVPLGAFLSGGLDSSIVVGTMASLSSEQISTFTVGFEEAQFDERWAAREVADYHDTNHHEYTVTPADVREAIPAVLDRLGEPFADPSLVPTQVVARETSRDMTVALSGDGADELFAGYDRYWGEHLSGYYRAVPMPVRRGFEKTIRSMPVDRTSRIGELTRKARKFTRGGASDRSQRHLEWARRPDDTAVELTDPDVVDEGVRLLSQQHNGVETWLPASRRDDLTRMQAVDTRHSLPDQILHKSDLAGMFNSLEVRVPFLDTDVVEYAFSLPRSYKLTTGSRKRILRRAFADVLPDRIEKRGKQGFDMPIGEWLTGPLEEGFRNEVGSLDGELLLPDATLGLLHDHRAGRGDHSGFLWSAYVYAHWRSRMEERGLL